MIRSSLFAGIAALAIASVSSAASVVARDDLARTLIDLHAATFTGTNLDGTRFDDANLRDARFVGVRIRGTSFARAAVDGVRFVGASVSDADLTREAGRAILRDCTGCSFRNLNLPDAHLSGTNLSAARLVGISAPGSDLSRTDLSGANVTGANLRDAHLTGATIGDAILCSENRGYDGDRPGDRTVCADLRDVDLHGIDLRAARCCAAEDGDRVGLCRAVTRRELIDDAHADLTGAQAPA